MKIIAICIAAAILVAAILGGVLYFKRPRKLGETPSDPSSSDQL
jgi:hypothetical protein